MNLELPEVAVAFGASVAKAIAAAGGVDLARRAEEDAGIRETILAPMLEGLGAFDLRFGTDPDGDLAAGELCRVAGRFALPFPVAAVLASADGPDRPLAVVSPGLPRVDHGGLFPRWRVATLDGAAAWDATPAGDPLGTKLGPFVTGVELGTPVDDEPGVPALLTLTAWQLLGTLEQARDLVVEHVTSRQQFGGPLSAFQSVQFQVADIAVAVRSLRELARYTTWRLSQPGPDHLVDALALRVHALETATQVLRASHQLHGAIGLCQEHDLSVLTRHSQPALRQPAGLEGTTELLLGEIDRVGFASLFGSGTPART